eukprot:IDg5144t1
MTLFRRDAHEGAVSSARNTHNDGNAPLISRGSSSDPWSDNYAPDIATADVLPTDYDRIYAFLKSLSMDGLRRIIGQLSPAEKSSAASSS